MSREGSGGEGMDYRIENAQLRVVISSLGGELQSIQNQEGLEYLWQGDAAIWAGRAPNLFPYIARLTEQQYCYKGEFYHMDLHGFMKDSDMKVSDYQSGKVTFYMEENERTQIQYPFMFRYELTYELVEDTIIVTYIVKNKGLETMFFGIGGHPGFQIPLEKQYKFEEYYLEFPYAEQPKRIGMSPGYFVDGTEKDYELRLGNYLDLQHSLFDQDAIILKDMGKLVRIGAGQGRHGVEVSYPQMNYLGIWHAEHTKANYVCMEPWSSLPSREGIIEDIAKQDNLMALSPGKQYENRWKIRLY